VSAVLDLPTVTLVAEGLEVAYIVGATLRARDNVIHVDPPFGTCCTTQRAPASGSGKEPDSGHQHGRAQTRSGGSPR